MTTRFHTGPLLDNQYEADHRLRSYLRRALPAAVHAEVEPDLRRMGARVVTDIPAMADDAESREPRLVQYDPWGQRIDRIITAQGWRDLDAVSAEEGLVAIGYERTHGEFSRLYQFAKLYLFTPSSAVYTCPLGMTDGAARLIEVHGDEELKREPYRRLTSRDPQQFWTSGQWMTERAGGSDISNTETVARGEASGFRLHGDKWFTSATTSQIAITLARIEDAEGRSTPGSRGLSLFYLETHRTDGTLNHITIHRLKDKLGTRAVPTAEITLDGTPARLVGEPGHGVRQIATLFNITRIYNAIAAVSSMRRCIALLQDYARRRIAFGKNLADHPLFVETLARMEVELAGAFHLTFYMAELLGKEECRVGTPQDSAVLRLLTPLAKLYTAKQAIAVASEVLEGFGGAGYVEDTGLPKLLRDAQVLSIWEGTTNVLSLDVLRAIRKDEILPAFFRDALQRLDRVREPQLSAHVENVRSAVQALIRYSNRMLTEGSDFAEAGARGFAYGLCRTFAASLLLEHADWSSAIEHDTRAALAAQRWCEQDLAPLIAPDVQHRTESRALALDGSLSAAPPAFQHSTS